MASGGAGLPRPAAVALQAGGETPRLSYPTSEPGGGSWGAPSRLGQAHHLSKDYERLPETREAMIYGVMSQIMLRRLTRAA